MSNLNLDESTVEGRRKIVEWSIAMSTSDGSEEGPLYRFLAETYYIPGRLTGEDIHEIILDVSRRVAAYNRQKMLNGEK